MNIRFRSHAHTDPFDFFQAGSAEIFSIKVWLKFFEQGLVDPVHAIKQGLGSCWKNSKQGSLQFFNRTLLQFFTMNPGQDGITGPNSPPGFPDISSRYPSPKPPYILVRFRTCKNTRHGSMTCDRYPTRDGYLTCHRSRYPYEGNLNPGKTLRW